MVAGHIVVNALDEVWQLLGVNKRLTKPIPECGYTLLFLDSEGRSSLPNHPQLKLLGHDLTDEHWSWSTLHGPCVWVRNLEAATVRRGEKSVLDIADARLVQALFRKDWPGIPQFSVWEMFEVYSCIGQSYGASHLNSCRQLSNLSAVSLRPNDTNELRLINCVLCGGTGVKGRCFNLGR